MDADSLSPIAPEHTPPSSGLPTIKEIYVTGYELFKENSKTLMLIGGSYILVYAAFIALISVTAIGGVAMFASNMAVLILLIIIGIGLSVLFGWVFSWTMLSMRYAIVHHAEKPTLKQSFIETKKLVWQFIWLNFLQAAAMLIPIVIIGIVILLVLLLKTVSLTIIVSILGVLGIFAVIVVLSVWLGFSMWTFLADNKREVPALRASRELSRGRFWPVLGRLLGFSLPIAIGIFIASIILSGVLFAALGKPIGNIVSQILVDGFEFVFIVPLMLCFHFVVFEALRKSS